MATDFGTDIQCDANGHGTSWPLASGWRVVANALSRRLVTPRGSLPWDTDYGYDVRGLLNSALRPGDMGAIRAAIETECMKDYRVQAASTTITWTGGVEKTARISTLITLASGPFKLVVTVGAFALQVQMLPA